jgi:hypothetical protein
VRQKQLAMQHTHTTFAAILERTNMIVPAVLLVRFALVDLVGPGHFSRLRSWPWQFSVQSNQI